MIAKIKEINKNLPKTFEAEYSHYLPLITICPVSKLPDIGYVKVHTKKIVEIYHFRKIVMKHTLKKIFMEDIARNIKEELKKLYELNDDEIIVEYKLIGGKVKIKV